MRFSVEQNDSIVIFTLKEPKLDAINAPDVKAELLIICQPTIEALILDLSLVKYCDSAGLSALLLAHRQMKEHEAPVFLAGASDQVRNLLRISQLEWLFDYFDSTEEALEQLGEADDTGDDDSY
jgi:anti-anti-sigma factor